MLQRLLHGDDIFISYSRADASLYAAGLADELTKRGYTCFLDQLGTEPDVDLPSTLTRKIKACTVCVLLGTERALVSKAVAKEIEEFKTTKRTIIPVYFVSAPEDAPLYKVIPGLARATESPAALSTGDPSEQVVSRIQKSFNYTRRNNRLGRIAVGTALLLLLLFAGAIYAGGYAAARVSEVRKTEEQLWEAQQQLGEAQQQVSDTMKLAEESTARATAASADAVAAANEARTQGELAKRNEAEAKRQQDIARAEAANARKQSEIARTKAEEACVQTKRAGDERTKADAQAVAANARLLLGTDPEQSLLVSAHALSLLNRRKLERSSQIEDVWRRSLATSNVSAVLAPFGTPVRDGERTVYTSGATFSRDGSLAVTLTGRDMSVWDTKTKRQLARTDGTNMSDVTFTHDGSAVLWRKAAKVGVWDWRPEGGGGTRELKDPDSSARVMTNAAFSGDGKVVAIEDDSRIARVRDGADGRVIAPELRPGRRLDDVGFSHGGRFVYTVSRYEAAEGTTVEIWGLDGRRLGAIRAQSRVGLVALGPAARRVVIYPFDGVPELRDVSTGDLVKKLEGHELRVRSIEFGPGGRLLATGSEDGTARLWDAETGKELPVLAGHAGTVRELAFSRDESLVATASDDGSAGLWVTATGRRLTAMLGHSGPVAHVAFSPDDGLLLTLSQDGTGRLWETSPDRRPFTELKPRVAGNGNRRYLTWAGFSADGLRLLTAGIKAEEWDAVTGRILNESKTGPAGMRDIVRAWYSPDWRLYVSNIETRVKVFDAKTGREVSTLAGAEGPRDGAVFDPAGKVVVTLDDWAGVYDVATGREMFRIPGYRPDPEKPGRPHGAAFSLDGRFLAVAAEGRAQVWDVWALRKVTDLPQSGVMLGKLGVAFSPDGLTVATAGDGVVIWDAATGERLDTFRQDYENQVSNAVAFSRDGQLIAAANDDGSTQVWDWKTRERVHVFRDSLTPVERLAFSPDGRLLLTAHSDGIVRLYPEEMFLPIRSLEGRLPSRVTRPELTSDERKRYLPSPGPGDAREGGSVSCP